MIDIFFIYAAVQIVLESLPISSSGHLALVSCWCAQHGCAVELSRSFEYLLHGPTLIMLAAYSVRLWLPLVQNLWQRRVVIKNMIIYVLCADSITTVVYAGVQAFVAPQMPLWFGFCITGGLLLSLRWCSAHDTLHVPVVYKSVTLRTLCLLGVVQGLAGLPGVSRFASTYVAGRWLHLTPRKSLFVSIMLQWPLMFGGFLVGLLRAHTDSSTVWFTDVHNILLMSVCAVLAYFVLWFVQWLLERERLWLLGPYLMIPALLAFVWC